jgi:hypothetical protein
MKQKDWDKLNKEIWNKSIILKENFKIEIDELIDEFLSSLLLDVKVEKND